MEDLGEGGERKAFHLSITRNYVVSVRESFLSPPTGDWESLFYFIVTLTGPSI